MDDSRSKFVTDSLPRLIVAVASRALRVKVRPVSTGAAQGEARCNYPGFPSLIGSHRLFHPFSRLSPILRHVLQRHATRRSLPVAIAAPESAMAQARRARIVENGILKSGVHRFQNVYPEGYLDIHLHSMEVCCRPANDLGVGRVLVSPSFLSAICWSNN